MKRQTLKILKKMSKNIQDFRKIKKFKKIIKFCRKERRPPFVLLGEFNK